MHSNRISLSCAFLLVALAASPIAHAAAICPAGNALSTPTTDFTIDNVNHVVTHLKTGLMWKQCTEGQSGASCAIGASTPMTWGQALSSAATPFAGYNDWRLPNEKELKSIVETGCYSPTINDTAFPNTPNVSFWSSTSYTGHAFTVNFDLGMSNDGFKTSSGNYVRLVRGGQTFDSFDAQADTIPTAFTFVDQTGVALSTQITSAPVQITGINAATNWTATTGTACVSSGNNCTCDVAAHAASGTITNNQYLCAQHTSSASNSTATNTLVTVGGVSDTFTSTTLAAVVTDTTPNAFTFGDQTGVALSSQITSAPVQITGINAATNWTATTGTACVSSGNNCTCDVAAYAASGTITNNQYLCTQHTSSASNSTATNTLVTVGGVSDTFTSTTLAAVVTDTTPNAFTFGDQSGVALSTQVTSAPVQITGINAATSWTATTGTACVSSGNNCTCDVVGYAASGSITNNQYLCVRQNSSASGSTATHTLVTVGGVSDTFSSTTQAQAGPQAPNPTTPTAIPTLSEWGALLLTGMLGLFGMGMMRRRASVTR